MKKIRHIIGCLISYINIPFVILIFIINKIERFISGEKDDFEILNRYAKCNKCGNECYLSECLPKNNED